MWGPDSTVEDSTAEDSTAELYLPTTLWPLCFKGRSGLSLRKK